MSWDVGPGNDGSYLDFYRYMIDVASMDFGSLTDHQGGGHYAYWWWLTQKSADMYLPAAAVRAALRLRAERQFPQRAPQRVSRRSAAFPSSRSS